MTIIVKIALTEVACMIAGVIFGVISDEMRFNLLSVIFLVISILSMVALFVTGVAAIWIV